MNSCLVYSSSLKMEVTCSSEMPVDLPRTTGRYIPEDTTLQNHRYENLRLCSNFFVSPPKCASPHYHHDAVTRCEPVLTQFPCDSCNTIGLFGTWTETSSKYWPSEHPMVLTTGFLQSSKCFFYRFVLLSFCVTSWPWCLSQWPRGLRHELSLLSRMLGFWVRIPLKAWTSVCVYSVFVLFFVWAAALRRADPPSKESYRLCICLRK
jgi:hypothetical protein